MKNFAYTRAGSETEAINLKLGDTKYLGGGTSLVDLMRENIEQPSSLIDIAKLPGSIRSNPNGTIDIDGSITNTQLATDLLIRTEFPCLSQAILAGASGQIRNMATVAGNIMQRTRCYYFYDAQAKCNKRKPESGCDAIDGFNRIHAIFGSSNACIATHPSDMCVALAALDATIIVKNKTQERQILFDTFHRLPGDTPHIETMLDTDEIIKGITISQSNLYKNSTYRKVRDRASYAFSLVSIAGAIEMEGDAIKATRIALGGVAHKPWRAKAAENFLLGKAATSANFLKAANLELECAKAFSHNDFKIELVRRMILNTMLDLSAQNSKNSKELNR